eukprot:3307780-Alexandrium_andersonii.AAC.1
MARSETATGGMTLCPASREGDKAMAGAGSNSAAGGVCPGLRTASRAAPMRSSSAWPSTAGTA